MSVNNFMCIVISHRDDSIAAFQAQFLCRIAENDCLVGFRAADLLAPGYCSTF